MKFPKFRLRWPHRMRYSETCYTCSNMTKEQRQAFDEAFDAMGKAFEAMDRAFDAARTKETA